MAYTTIQVSPKTRSRLSVLKRYMRGTYDELLNSLIDIVPTHDDEGEYTEEFRASLLRSLMDIKRGRVYTSEEVKARLGV